MFQYPVSGRYTAISQAQTPFKLHFDSSCARKDWLHGTVVAILAVAMSRASIGFGPFRNCILTWLHVVAVLVAVLFAPAVKGQSNLPALTIAPAAEGVTVSWPLTAYYSVLEAATNLSTSAPWVGVATAARAASFASYSEFTGYLPIATNVVGSNVAVNLAATNVQQYFHLGSTQIPVFGFAIFYNGLLEFSSAPAWTVKGSVHANGAIYTGSGAPLAFVETVTTAQTISSPTNNGATAPWTYRGTFDGSPTNITYVPPLFAQIGTTNAHALIDMPAPGVPPTNRMERSRLYNLAQVVLLISNTTVTAKIQASPTLGSIPGDDPSPLFLNSPTNTAALATYFPFLTLTNAFADQRENKMAFVADIDVNVYRIWVQTNALVQAKTLTPTILYIANNRTYSSSLLPTVRLRNARELPWNAGLGFTVATRNPLYVYGHYNCVNDAALGTTNTSYSVPAALMSDALTILSTNWNDATSYSSYTTRDAADTTINAAILTGNVPSTGTSFYTYSGGAANLPRLLEDWQTVAGGQRALTLNTSLACLFSSSIATNQYRNPGNYALVNAPYFDPPKRQFTFDFRFRSIANLPPGTPLVSMAEP
jgi:hypothetical protein